VVSRVAVLVSGGVDSAVALRLLAEGDDHHLEAFYLKIWLEDEMAFMGSCPWQEDLLIVRQLCEELDLPLHVISLQNEYFQTVVASTVDELRAGRTPSPDVICNRHIKFGAFVERIGHRFEHVASGHHARRHDRDGRAHLLRAADPVKDQTYFLSQLRQHQLRRCLFPVGDYTKAEVRELARDFGLVNAERADSQGICFLGRIPYDDFVRFHLGERSGEIVDMESGRALGEHRGYWFHTIGQRRGLGLAGGPWYVVSKDEDRNIIYVAHGDQRDGTARRVFVVPEPNWIADPPACEDLQVKVRHGPELIAARVRVAADGCAEVELGEADAGIAPGQFAVFYGGQECLGGGAIG
jgi:tRNA-specific 2-thiouridylase